MLSATTLMAATVWLLRQGKKRASFVTLLPGVFMTMVIATFILWTPGTDGQPWGLVPGGLKLDLSVMISAGLAFLFVAFVLKRGKGE
jgi:carbon starvation protein CstA